MNDKIKHIGTIKSIDGNHIQVEIIQKSACSSCSVAQHCNAAESKEKIIDVYQLGHSIDYQIGETVNVYVSERMGKNAVMLAFVFPFVVMLLFMYLAYRMVSGNELVAAGVGLASLIVYYIVLYLFRKKLNDTFTFFIEPISDK